MPSLRNDLWEVQSPEARKIRRGVSASYDLPGRPDSPWPTLPKQLVRLRDESLMELLAEIHAWMAHVGGMLFLQEIDERFHQEELDRMLAQAYESASGQMGEKKSETSVTRAKALRELDPDVQEAKSELRETKGKVQALEYLHSVLERNSFLLSRELTRRLGRVDKEVRTARYSS